jgi:hypothetical protein
MANEAALEDSFTQEIAKLLESFSEKDTVGKQSLSQLLVSDPKAFGASAIEVLAKCQVSPGSRYLVHLLMKGKMLPAILLDPRTVGLRQSMAAIQAVNTTGTNLQPMLELALNKTLQDQSSPENSDRILRLLDLLAAIAPPTFWNSFQLELMAHPDRLVRSKAALVIGRSSKNAAWIGRRFMDRDSRVQASAVEALWALEPAESRALLLTASKSKHNRVAANAILGLYRIGDLKAVRLLMDLVRQQESPAFQLSALWAIGETLDPRFLPFLLEQFKSSDGKMRLAVTRAMASIRRQEKINTEAGTLRFQVSQARVSVDGKRRCALVLSSQPPRDLGVLTPLEFALWEGSELIENYEVKLSATPAALAVGFVVPRFTSNSDPYGQALTPALTRCSASKRPHDLWRIDRYSLEPPKEEEKVAKEQSFLPYDDAIATQEIKMRQCFIASPDILSKAISTEVSRERAAADVFAGIQRQCDAMVKHAGKRHLFLFLHEISAASLEDQDRLASVKTLLAKERIMLHAFAPGIASACAAFRTMCLSLPDNTFSDVPINGVQEKLEETYSTLMNGCEVSYQLPSGAEAASATLKVSSSVGAGQVDIPWVRAVPVPATGVRDAQEAIAS